MFAALKSSRLTTDLLLADTVVLEHLQANQRVCSAVVLDDIDVRVESKHVLESMCECVLVQLVGLVADAVYQSAINVEGY